MPHTKKEASVGNRSRRPHLRRGLFAGAVVMLAVVTGACGGGASNGAAAPSSAAPIPTSSAPSVPTSTQPSLSGVATPQVDVAAGGMQGPWDGTWTSTSSPGTDGTFHIDFTQAGGQLNGTITVTDTPCFTAGTIFGVLEGNSIKFGAVNSGQNLNYTGTVSGTSMSGTYSAPRCGNGKGTWEAATA